MGIQVAIAIGAVMLLLGLIAMTMTIIKSVKSRSEVIA